MHRVYNNKEKAIPKDRDERERNRVLLSKEHHRDSSKRDHHRDDKNRNNRDGRSRDYSVKRHQSDKYRERSHDPTTTEGSSRDERDKQSNSVERRRPLSTHKRKECGDTEELLHKHDKRAKSSSSSKEDKHRWFEDRHVDDDTRDLNGIDREERKERRTFDENVRAANKKSNREEERRERRRFGDRVKEENVTSADMEKQQQQHPVVKLEIEESVDERVDNDAPKNVHSNGNGNGNGAALEPLYMMTSRVTEKSSTDGITTSAGAKSGSLSLDALANAKKALQMQKKLSEKYLKKIPLLNKAATSSSDGTSQSGLNKEQPKAPSTSVGVQHAPSANATVITPTPTSTSCLSVVTPACAKPCASGMPTLPGLANVPNIEAVKRAQELAAKMGFHQDPEFDPLINMLQMPVEVAVQQKPAKTPVLRLDVLGIEIDEHGNVINMPKLTNLSTLKFNINTQKMETFQILKPELDVDPESNPQYDESMGINKAKLLRLKRMSFEFVEEETWSKQTEIFKFKSQFGEAQAKELKTKQAQLAKAKADPDINPNLIEVSERIITKEKPKDVIPDVEWWDVPLLLSGTYCDITEDSITEDKLKLDKMAIYVEHPLPIQPPVESAPPLPIVPPAEPAPLPPQPLKLTKQKQKKLCTQRRLAKEKDWLEMIRQGLLEPPKAKVKLSNLMKLVWKLKTTHRVQLFLRDLLSDCLAIRSLLAERVTISDNNCPWCPSPETSMHLFVNCDLAKNVWALANIHNPTHISESTTFMEWFSYWSDNQRIQKSLKIQILSSVCCVLWAIWDSRNNSIFKNVPPPIPEQIFMKARSMLIPDNPWEVPPIDYLKLNFDGAWNCTTKLGFTGWIIRDHLGHFVAGGADRGQFSSAKETEAYALLDGLKFIINANLRKVVCEGDAQMLINQIINNYKRPADSPSTEAILRDCIYLLGYGNFVNLCWVHRTFNRAAHHIALWVKQTDISFKQCWSSPPCWLEEDLIRGDVNPPPLLFSALTVG